MNQKFIVRSSVLIIITLVFAVASFGQALSDRDKGIELYKNGNFAEAITKLNGSADVNALYYLGLSFEKVDKPKDAANAFEQSFKAGYAIFEQKLGERFDIRIRTKKDNFANFLKELVPLIETSIASAQNAVRLKAKMARQNEWLLRANSMLAVGKIDLSGELVYTQDEVDSDLKITSKPRANYTDKARSNNISGTVTLLTVYRSDGTTRVVAQVKALPDGLTDEAIIAAKKIKFEPGMKNGKPVSVIAMMEYSFSIY